MACAQDVDKDGLQRWRDIMSSCEQIISSLQALGLGKELKIHLHKESNCQKNYIGSWIGLIWVEINYMLLWKCKHKGQKILCLSE
jgi:hypothetical protein